MAARRLEVEEVVEARDRLQVGGGHAHHRGALADALRGAPAVAALDREQGRDRGRALLRVAGHDLLDLGAQVVGDADLVRLGDLDRGGVRRRPGGPCPRPPPAPSLTIARDLVALAERGVGIGNAGSPLSPGACSRSSARRGGHLPARAPRSPVDAPEDRVEHREVGDQVGDVPADAHLPQRLQVDERRLAHVDADRLRRAVGDEEAAELAARATRPGSRPRRAARGSPR